jgi:hypothetical protein
MTLVRLTGQPRFVALSYMWEQRDNWKHHNPAQLLKGNLENLETPGGLRRLVLPPLIPDVMAICRSLGERYLWIDRFCIIQDDSRSKHSQISSMDSIYRSAFLTIIASLNVRDGGSIPGITSPRSSASRNWSREELNTTLRANQSTGYTPIVPLKRIGIDTVDGSLWNHRGWTFQERVFSRRRLYITEFQALFECTTSASSEVLEQFDHPFDSVLARNDSPSQSFAALGFADDTWSDVDGSPYPDNSSFGERSTTAELVPERNGSLFPLDHRFSISLPRPLVWSLEIYLDYIRDFSSRQLSFSRDIVDAFQGVGTFASSAFDCRSDFGLLERYLPLMLTWRIRGNFERRADTEGVPTWSWMSSLRPVNFEGLEKLCSDPEVPAIISPVRFYYPEVPVFRRVNVEKSWVRAAGCLLSASHKVDLEQQWGKLSTHAVRVGRGVPGSLLIRTIVASLYIRFRPGKEESDICITQSGRAAGRVQQMDWFRGAPRRQFNFIFLCLTAPPVTDQDRPNGDYEQGMGTSNENSQPRVQVMMVEHLPPWTGVFTRVSVGYINPHWWPRCDRRFETIVLC